MTGPVAESKNERVIARAREHLLRLKAEVAGWESFIEAASQSPAFVSTLEAMLGDQKSNGIPHPEHIAPQRKPDVLNWQRVWTYLMATGNKWTSIRQIMEGTGLKRDSVNGVLYTGGKTHLFETIKKPHGRTYWRVKEEFADKDKVPLLTDQSDEEPQDDQPTEETALADASEVVEEPKPARTGPRPKHAPANWPQN